MNNYSKIYWLTRLDVIESTLSTMTVISGIFVLFIGFVTLMTQNEFNTFRYVKIFFFVTLFLLVGNVFVPNKNDMILIYAGGKTLDYVQSDTSLQKIPYQTTTIISEYLDKTIKELKENK